MTTTTTTKNKSLARRHELNRIYAHPLPILFPTHTLGLSLHKRIENPACEGVFDHTTASVWVINREHALILWRRGFFGKGDLSRSEPSWWARLKNKEVTSEEITARRRAERRQFKLERAQAIAAVAEEAEMIFEREGRVVQPALSGPAIPSAATWKPARSVGAGVVDPGARDGDGESSEEDEEEDEDIEHLQLTLQEAWFLSWTMNCLTILDPQTETPIPIRQLWTLFHRAQLHFSTGGIPSGVSEVAEYHFDNPFLVQYVAYHHYRSLGWVVKGGIKFCVDYLLYKRGPVFAHAEFALVLIPVYEDPQDRTTSPFTLSNVDPFSWSWLSTINRVNSQVQKTLILVYVTIPSRTRVSPKTLESPACIHYYSIREVIVRRFVPARMRD